MPDKDTNIPSSTSQGSSGPRKLGKGSSGAGRSAGKPRTLVRGEGRAKLQVRKGLVGGSLLQKEEHS